MQTIETTSRLNIYKIEKLPGKGTYGSVYEATNTETGKQVAIKQITLDPSIDKDVFQVMMLTIIRELEILYKLSQV